MEKGVISEMSKVKITALLLMILLTVTASTAIASANGTTEIEFNALVKGECFVGLTIMTFIPGPPYYDLEIVFDGLGKGTVGMSGSSEAVSVPTSPPTEPPTEPPFYLLGEEVYFAESLSAQGFTSVSWKDDDKNRHWLFVSIYSTEPNPLSNIFSPEADYFWMPMPGPEEFTLLGFDAIHVSRSGYEVISGMALFAVMPFPFEPWVEELYDPAVVLFLLWIDEEVGIQYQYSILWSSETRGITHLYPFDPFDVKAARVFNSNVEVVS